MFTKTLRKRIALVAVSALTAGLVSVVAIPAANAAAGDIDDTAGSVGLLAAPTIADGSTTMTATLLSTGTLSITTDTGGYLVVSAGAYISGTDGTVGDIAADQKSITTGNGDIFTVKPTGAAGSTFTITGYSDDESAVVVSKLTVTIAASSVAGVVSAADSTVSWVATDGAAADADVAGENTTTYGTPLFLNIQLKDAYGAPIESTSGALVVTVSSGATVKLSTDDGAVGSNGTFNTAVSAADPSDLNARIAETTAGAGWKGTVTVTYNGVAIATKSGTITGAPASITVTPKKIGTTGGGANEDSFTFLVKDAAGNQLGVTATNYVLSSSSDLSIVSDAAGTEDGVVATGTPANGDHTCAGTAGSADVVLKTTINGTVLTVVMAHPSERHASSRFCRR
jgi:hypothetical protein